MGGQSSSQMNLVLPTEANDGGTCAWRGDLVVEASSVVSDALEYPIYV